MNSFFQTKEFIDFKKVHTRVQQTGGNTLKNIDIYITRLSNAAEIAEKNFNNIGFYLIDGWRPAYKWAPSPNLAYPNYDDQDIKSHLKTLYPEPEQIQTTMFESGVK